MDASALLAPAHAAATLFMAGLIWFVQVVHYPLFRRLGTTEAAAYAREHARRTGWVVGPVMLAELVLGLTLAARGGPTAWLALALLGVIWASTALNMVESSVHVSHASISWIFCLARSVQALFGRCMV